MGRRDYRHREPKKPKRDAKRKAVASTVLPSPMPVERIRKERKKKEEEEE